MFRIPVYHYHILFYCFQVIVSTTILTIISFPSSCCTDINIQKTTIPVGSMSNRLTFVYYTCIDSVWWHIITVTLSSWSPIPMETISLITLLLEWRVHLHNCISYFTRNKFLAPLPGIGNIGEKLICYFSCYFCWSN